MPDIGHHRYHLLTPASATLTSPLPARQRSTVSSTDTVVFYPGIAVACRTSAPRVSVSSTSTTLSSTYIAIVCDISVVIPKLRCLLVIAFAGWRLVVHSSNVSFYFTSFDSVFLLWRRLLAYHPLATCLTRFESLVTFIYLLLYLFSLSCSSLLNCLQFFVFITSLLFLVSQSCSLLSFCLCRLHPTHFPSNVIVVSPLHNHNFIFHCISTSYLSSPHSSHLHLTLKSLSFAAVIVLFTPGTYSYLFLFYLVTSISILVLLNLPNSSSVPSMPDLSFSLAILLLSQNSRTRYGNISVFYITWLMLLS